jgi:hypothetical protein
MFRVSWELRILRGRSHRSRCRSLTRCLCHPRCRVLVEAVGLGFHLLYADEENLWASGFGSDGLMNSFCRVDLYRVGIEGQEGLEKH